MKSSKKRWRTWIALMSPFFLGLLAWFFWIYELVEIIGWTGLQWLRAPIYSCYPIILCVVLSFLVPIACWYRMLWYKWILAAGGLYLVSLGAYFGSAQLLFTLYTGWERQASILSLWGLLAIVGVTSTWFYVVKQWIIGGSGSLHIYTLSFAFLSVVPLSMISVELWPGWGVHTQFIDAVKMGYPVFWICVLLGWSAYFLLHEQHPVRPLSSTEDSTIKILE